MLELLLHYVFAIILEIILNPMPEGEERNTAPRDVVSAAGDEYLCNEQSDLLIVHSAWPCKCRIQNCVMIMIKVYVM